MLWDFHPSVTIHTSFGEAVAYTQTDEYRTDMRLRPLIEQTIAILVRYRGARHARVPLQA